jgi:hypothetical protein
VVGNCRCASSCAKARNYLALDGYTLFMLEELRGTLASQLATSTPHTTLLPLTDD